MIQRIRVVIVDDSPIVCRILASFLSSSPEFEVVGIAHDGAAGVDLVVRRQPDVVTLDLEMPKMNGLEALDGIMIVAPTPVIMVSGVSRRAAAATRKALERGAIDFILKYTPGVDLDPEALRLDLVAKVRAGSKVKVIRSLRKRSVATQTTDVADPATVPLPMTMAVPPDRPFPAGRRPSHVIVVGASTGGPVALRELLSHLPGSLSAAVVIVQHMPESFTAVLAAQLNRSVGLPVKEAKSGDRLVPGHVFVAPGGFHLLFRSDYRVELSSGPAIGGHRPSVDVTMQSAAQIFGSRTRGVVLTGMGGDGTLGLLAIQANRGETFAQDAASCVVHGMPGRAVERGVVDYVAAPAQIATLLSAGLQGNEGAGR